MWIFLGKDNLHWACKINFEIKIIEIKLNKNPKEELNTPRQAIFDAHDIKIA